MKYTLKRIFTVVINSQDAYTRRVVAKNNTDAAICAYGMQVIGKWNPACYIEWRWELRRHKDLMWAGRRHIRTMKGWKTNAG